MKRLILLLLFASFFQSGLMAQKFTGIGGEISALSVRPCVTDWFSKKSGFEIFAGQAAELGDFKPNDLEVGAKFMRTIIYNRTDRTYFAITGKWKWVNVYDSYQRTSLPVPGILIGKEWYSRRVNRKAFAVELGYQLGTKEYKVYNPVNNIEIGKNTFEEFPLILNLRYTFVKVRR